MTNVNYQDIIDFMDSNFISDITIVRESNGRRTLEINGNRKYNVLFDPDYKEIDT